MQGDERDLPEVLKFGLKFPKDGGYGRSQRHPGGKVFRFATDSIHKSMISSTTNSAGESTV